MRRLPACFAIMALALGASGGCVAPRRAPADRQRAVRELIAGLPAGAGAIPPAAFREQIRQQQPFILDVREPGELDSAGYIAGATPVPLRRLMHELDRLPARSSPIVVVCASGHRSAVAMAALRLMGYGNVSSLEGGMTAWKAAALPVASGRPDEARVRGTPVVPVIDDELVAVIERTIAAMPAGWNTIPPSALQALLATSQPLQIDLRDDGEIASAGAIVGATRVPFKRLMDNLHVLPPDKGAPIVVECSNGHRSAIAMFALNLLGYSNVRSLTGGIDAWARAGLPLVKST